MVPSIDLGSTYVEEGLGGHQYHQLAHYLEELRSETIMVKRVHLVVSVEYILFLAGFAHGGMFPQEDASLTPLEYLILSRVWPCGHFHQRMQ